MTFIRDLLTIGFITLATLAATRRRTVECLVEALDTIDPKHRKQSETGESRDPSDSARPRTVPFGATGGARPPRPTR